MAPTLDSSNVYVDERRFRRYVKSSLIGFLILCFGILGGLRVSNYEACESRASSVTQISDTIGGILHRLDTANLQQFKKGRVTPAERSQAHSFYTSELSKLPISDKCSLLSP